MGESWKSTFGFAIAATGSAVGLVNIWRFPYVVGQYGGAAFIAIYLIFLVLIGFPVLVSEVLIGRTARSGPGNAFFELSGSKTWGGVGKGITLIGFVVSSFYSVVAGWILGYLFLAFSGSLGKADNLDAAKQLFEAKLSSSFWCVGTHILFMLLSALVLIRGVRRGIEASNRLLMPLLVLLLVGIAIRGLTLPGGAAAVGFLLRPDWSAITPLAILTALGHAFFTLSLGQGTMITYGSYLRGGERIGRTCSPIIAADTLISLVAAVAVISLVFAGGENPNGGPGLLFFTLPAVFASFPGGSFVAIAFFLMVLFAALTSQTSAMEPLINYLTQQRKWRRPVAVLAVAGGGLLLGIPSALSFNLLSRWRLFGQTFFDLVSFVTTDIFIPLGGLLAVVFVGWKWGFGRAAAHLAGEGTIPNRSFRLYLNLCVRFVSPMLIGVVLLRGLGLF